MTMAIKGLSERELNLRVAWERQNRRLITLGDLRGELGSAAYNVASRLEHKGVLSRVGRGVYAVRPLRSIGRPHSVSPLAAAAVEAADEDYYCGGLGVLNLHGLTEQYYPGRVDLFSTRRRKPKLLARAQIHFHLAHASDLLLGVEETTIDGVQVRISDPERTVLDLLEHPHLAGGTAEAIKIVSWVTSRVNASKLVRYAASLARPTTCRRLGLILERAGVPSQTWRPLLKSVRRAAHGAAFVPDAPKRGVYSTRWRLSINDAEVGS
jgi:predicted transcriptional regulator of viral defense system